jgi:hypothetical protein
MESNHLIKFKQQLWQYCLDNEFFNNIPEQNVEQCNKIFEYIVSNYTSQIMQTDNTNALLNIIGIEVKKNVDKLKLITHNEIKNKDKEDFDMKFKQMQDDFNNMHKKNVPPPPDEFNKNINDEPIDSNSLEQLINQQLKERENMFNSNLPSNLPTINETNDIILDNHTKTLVEIDVNNNENNNDNTTEINKEHNNLKKNINNINNEINTIKQITLDYNKEQYTEIKDKIDNLDKKLDIVISSMSKLINSHISLLKKIK